MRNNERQGDASLPLASSGRWFAVILLRYNDHDPFWTRDAGLFFQGFKANGVDTRFVLMGDPYPGQDPAMVLASQAQMEDPAWWRQWGLTGVALYSWALPRFTAVARAVKQAGIRIVLIIDTDGVIMPQVWPARFFQIKYFYAKSSGSLFPFSSALLRTLVAGKKSRYRGVVDHLEYAHVIALPSPTALQRYRRFLDLMGRADMARKLAVVYHPVADSMTWSPGREKQPLILTVGGWERLVKGGELMVEVLGAVLQQERGYRARIIGSGEDRVRNWLARLPEAVRSRITVAGPVASELMPQEYQPAQICLNTSTSESFGIACAEALCCGCSVVGHALIGSMVHFCSFSSGTVASSRSLPNFTDAVLAEISAWRAGERDPAAISANWTERLHASRIAERVMKL
jgi:glycosyltransferase involved in cell wall biosynthesis